MGPWTLAQSITKAEYFFNQDPGIGSGIQVALQSEEDEMKLTANVSELRDGLHTIYVRIQDENGNWSLSQKALFYKLNGGAINGPSTISEIEYFFDSDPGIGNGLSFLPLSNNDNDQITFAADISSIDNGLHTIYVRTKDSFGRWSLMHSDLFLKLTGDGGGDQILQVEYFIDQDPGLGKAVSLPYVADEQGNMVFNANLSEAPIGLHKIYIRTLDTNGTWSLLQSKTFIKLNGDGGTKSIVAAEYFFNDDPGMGDGIPIEIPSDQTGFDISVVLDIPELSPPGYQQFYLRVKDNTGAWSLLNHQELCYPTASAGFSHARFGNRFSFIDESIGATGYRWDFGDGVQDTVSNPAHEFSPGIYNVEQIVFNECSADTTHMELVIRGVEDFFPKSGGNTGDVTISLFGGGFDENTAIQLRRDGFESIAPITTTLIGSSEVQLTFDLRTIQTGEWTLNVTYTDSESSNNLPFEIISGQEVNVVSEISGPSLFRPGRPSLFVIKATNTSNIDASGVPVWIGIEKVSDLTSRLKTDLAIPSSYPSDIIDYDSIGTSIQTEGFFGIDSPNGFEVYPLFLPYLAPGETTEIELEVTSFSQIKIYSVMSKPYFNSPINPQVMNCIYNVAANVALDEAIRQTEKDVEEYLEEVIPLYPCLTLAETRRQTRLEFLQSEGRFEDVASLIWNHTTAALDCTFSGFPLKKAAKGVRKVMEFIADAKKLKKGYDAIKDIVEDIKDVQDCLDPYFNEEVPSPFISTPVRSFDPNEKYSSVGSGGAQFINQSRINYEIAFENIDTAEVAAQIVTLIDTLDKEIFDLRSLELNYFIIDDSTYIIPPYRSGYTVDIDHLEETGLIVRFNAQLDTVTGVMKTTFLSLDPETLELTNDVFAGFLPPNVDPTKGEGRVGFSIGLKPNLHHGTEIRNKASIIFDFNEPIITNETLNTLDLTLPVSSVNTLNSYQKDTTFTVSWTGADVGAGVFAYDVYVSENEKAFELWQFRTSELSADFTAHPDSTYRFYAVATDLVGNVEEKTPVAEVNIEVGESEISLEVDDALDFSLVDVNTTATASFTITNTGNVGLVVSDIQYPDGFMGDYPNGTIVAGGSQEVNVTFSPESGQAFTGKIIVNSDAQNSDNELEINGTGAARIITLGDALDFGIVDVNTTSNQTLSISNMGNVNLTIESVNLPIGFTTPYEGGTISPGASEEITISFNPNLAEGFSGNLSFTTDATSGNNTVSLTGTGAARIISGAADLAFGEIDELTSLEKSFEIENEGNVALTIASIDLPIGYSISPEQAVIEPGATLAFTVNFSPHAGGDFSGKLTLNSDATSGSEELNLTATSASRQITIEGSLDFGFVDVGKELTKSITIKNNGNRVLSLSGITLPSGFKANADMAEITPGDDLEVTVTFTPNEGRSFDGTFEINANTTSGGNSIAVAGTGAARIIVADPEVDFGEIDELSSLERVIVLANTGNVALNINEIVLPEGYSVSPAQGTIQPNSALEFNLSFNPQTGGDFSGTLTLDTDATSGNETVNLSASSASRVIVLNDTFEFGFVDVNVTSSAILTIANDGNRVLKVSEITVPEGFSSDTQTLDLAPGNAAEVTISFTPDEGKEFSGEINVTSNATRGTKTLNVNGTGAERIIVTYDDVDFGNIDELTFTTQTFTIENNGNVDLNVDGISLPEAFIVNWSAGTIPPQSSQMVEITFQPQEGKPYEGELIISSDATSGDPIIALNGIGNSRILSSNDLGFGTTDVNSTHTAICTVKNLGNDHLEITSVTLPEGFSTEWEGSTIAPGMEVSFDINFKPTDNIDYNGTASFQSDNTSGPSSVRLVGNGAGSIIVLSGSGSFQQTGLGLTNTQTIEINNTGNKAMTVTNISVNAPFSTSWSSGEIAAGDVQEVVVTFEPTAPTSYNSTLTVESDAFKGENTFALSGVGLLVTNIDRRELDEKVKLYPNPTNGEFINIDFGDLVINGDILIQLVDVNGSDILKKSISELNDNKLPLKLPSLAGGVYQILITFNDKTVVKRFMNKTQKE